MVCGIVAQERNRKLGNIDASIRRRCTRPLGALAIDLSLSFEFKDKNSRVFSHLLLTQHPTSTLLNMNSSETTTKEAPLWPYAFHSIVKPIQDKHGECAKCHILPPDGKMFRKCSACKSVLYCSPDCQKADWKAHRCVFFHSHLMDFLLTVSTQFVVCSCCSRACKQMQDLKTMGNRIWGQNTPSSSSTDGTTTSTTGSAPPSTDAATGSSSVPFWPSDIPPHRREAVLDEFLTLQRGNFRRAIMGLRGFLRSKHGRDIDTDHQALLWVLGYRATPDGNPATRFYVQGVQAVKWQKRTGDATGKFADCTRTENQTKTSGVEPWMPYKERDPANPDEFEVYGVLKLIFMVGGKQTITMLPLTYITVDEPMWAPPPGRGDLYWLDDLRLATITGTIWDDDLWLDSEKHIAGVMRKTGKKWEWSEMRLEEKAFIGMCPKMFMAPEPAVDISLLVQAGIPVNR